MNFRLRASLVAAIGLGLAVAGCQEQLTAPGSCPATCPGGTPVVRDTILDAIVGGDSTFTGYLVAGVTPAGLLLSNGAFGDTNFGVIRFLGRSDSLLVKDTLRTYTIDSVAILVSLLARDTTASGIQLELHRVPKDSTATDTYAEVAPLMVPGTLMDTATVVDSIRGPHTYRFVFAGADLATVDIPAADSGVLAVGLAISGGTATGIRVGGGGSGAQGAQFQTYVTVNIADTTTAIKHQMIPRGTQGSRYFSNVATTIDPDLLTLGTDQVARALIRFPFPEYLKDSALISRATLELTPVDTIRGLTLDSVNVDVNGLVVDYGAKSPSASLAGFKNLAFGSIDTVRIEVGTELKSWQRATLPHPPAFLLNITPTEGASFTNPRFKSSRSASGRPRLHVTYQLPFAFERP